jgi:hypothetical protein
MARKAAIIKGSKVVRTKATGKWIEVTIRIPTETAARRGGKRLPKKQRAKVAREIAGK